MRTLALAGAEVRLLARDRTTFVSAAVMPLVVGLVLLQTDSSALGQPGSLAGMQVMVMLGITVYSGSTMSLTSRRSDLYLKRLRNSPLSSPGIVAGLTLPLFAIAVVQLGVVLAMLGRTAGSVPAHPELLVLAILIGGVMCVAVAFLTAAYTRTPQAAQMTMMPLLAVLSGGSVWTLMTPANEVVFGQLLIPGSGLVQLARLGWDGTSGVVGGLTGMTSTATAASLLVTAVCCLVAAGLFSWEPRD